jgi:hypothetical protein
LSPFACFTITFLRALSHTYLTMLSFSLFTKHKTYTQFLSIFQINKQFTLFLVSITWLTYSFVQTLVSQDK